MPLRLKTAEERSKTSRYFIPATDRSKWTQEEYLRHRAEKTLWDLDLEESNEQRRAEASVAQREPFGRDLNRYFRVLSVSNGSPEVRTGYTFHYEAASKAAQRSDCEKYKSKQAAHIEERRKAMDAYSEAQKAYEGCQQARSAEKGGESGLDPITGPRETVSRPCKPWQHAFPPKLIFPRRIWPCTPPNGPSPMPPTPRRAVRRLRHQHRPNYHFGLLHRQWCQCQ